ncbi:hypothetical protein DM02DRAFT_580620 [Periconia macrospinosa]|uniref:Zn(2)-C6 fungal-type domain-containing protein n=1 Tax=Periconia macrospinosa TaxID=97972 RepID=A0A2V1E9X9_9PLEO|nr:hypothetical protein DM02DRAFT_580620 [Periconia macrospinosa]
MNRTPARKVVPQACDACRRRKTKCHGRMPCQPCTSASLPCTFNTSQKKGGNRGVRATTLNQLREEYATSNRNGINIQNSESESHHALPSIKPLLSRSLSPTGLESIAIDTCVEVYLRRIHPIVPLLNSDLLREEANKATTSLMSRQFILSFCAYVLTFGKVLNDPTAIPVVDIGPQLVKSALEIQNVDRITRPCGLSLYISFFLYGAHAGMGDYRQGWFYLREATTLFTMQKPGDEWYDRDTYRRIFWILLISERAHAIRRQRPITLLITPSTPPLPLLSPPERGLHYLSSLFRPFDEAFFALWNFSREDCSKEWLIALEASVRTALPPLLDDISHDQVANIRVSQLWLQIKLWELFPRFGFLSSSESIYECLTFRYPLRISRDLTSLIEKLPRDSLCVHGVGMTEKIFDITCALADVLPFINTSSSPNRTDLDRLIPLTTLLSTLPSGREKFVPLLHAKLHELQPNLVPALVEAAGGLGGVEDENDGEERRLLGLGVGGVMSPGTRFLYEEEVGRGLFADLRRGGGGLGFAS